MTAVIHVTERDYSRVRTAQETDLTSELAELCLSHNQDAINLLKRARSARPDAVFGADLIAGFPTETDAMFENTLNTVAEMGLTYLHVFPYSARPGTAASKMPAVNGAIVKQRARRLRQAGDAALRRFLQSTMGERIEVLIEQGRNGHSRHFAPVGLPDQETMEFLKRYSGDLIVGRLRCGETIMDIPLGLDGSSLSQHLGIFATTGMGKSNLMKILASAVMEHGGYGLLIFDPHGEYYDGGKAGDRKGLIDHPLSGKRLVTYTRRKLKSVYETLTVPAHEIKIEDISQIFSFTQAQHEALHAIRSKFGKHWLERLFTSDLDQLAEDLTAGSSTFHENTLGVIKRRAERIKSFSTVVRDSGVSTIGDIVTKLQSGKTVLIDSANLSQAEETMITSVLTRAVLESYRYRYQTGGDFEKLTPCLILLEEAQRVLSASAGDSNIFHQVAREGRKFKVGMGVITQQPKLLSEELLSQLNSIFILGLADERDRNIVRSSAKQDISALSTEIQTLAAGESLLTSPKVPFALPLKIFLYEDYLGQLNLEPSADNRDSVSEKFF